MEKENVKPLTGASNTDCVHGGVTPDPSTGAMIPPIYQNTTFVQESVENYMSKGFTYSRSDNPTVRALEAKLVALEGGADACCFASGMAATCTLFSLFLRPGDHCIITNCSYGGTNRAARLHFSQFDVDFEFIDLKNIEYVRQRIRPNTKMIFSETPTNPILSLADVSALSKLAKEANGRIVHVCDSTFATPIITKPMDHGADFTLISTTKYYDGHNITVGGAVVSATKEIDDKVRWLRNVLGNIMTPMTAFYQLQTSKTLSLRVRRQCVNAQQIAEFLQAHPKVDKVGYPGLKDFGQRALAEKQHLEGLHGGMLWFEVRGGTEAGVRLMDSVKDPWSLCENLGTVESIITCPAVFTHAAMTREDRLAVGITDGFIRVSCGVEDAEDLIGSLRVALDSL